MQGSSCTEFERRLLETIETHGRADAEVFRAHADGCANCRRLWEDQTLLDRAVADWKAAAVPEIDVADAVLARHAFGGSTEFDGDLAIADRRQRRTPDPHSTSGPANTGSTTAVLLHSSTSGNDGARRSPAHRASGSGVLTVAALVLLAAVGIFGRPAPRPPTIAHSTLAAPSPPAPSPPAPVVATADVEMLVRDAGSAYLELARGAVDIFSDSVVLIPEQPLPLRPTRPDAGLSTEGWIPSGNELEPIRRDFNRAIDFLFQAISSDDEPTT